MRRRERTSCVSSQDSKPLSIEQGHCYLVDMNPPRKSKPGKIRPVVVVQSSDTLQAGSPGVVIVPLTSKIREGNVLRIRIRPAAGLRLQQPSDCLLDQLHTIDRSLFLQELGVVSTEDFQRIEEGIRFLMGF